MRERSERRGMDGDTLIVSCLVPTRVAGDVLGLLLLLLLVALEHLLEELELGGCEGEEGENTEVERDLK